MKVAIRFDPTFAGMSVWLYENKPDGEYIVKPTKLELEKYELGAQIEPTFRFNESGGTEFLNSLVNALVEAGFKPDEIKAHDRQVEAIKYHLEDMRSLALKSKK